MGASCGKTHGVRTTSAQMLLLSASNGIPKTIFSSRKPMSWVISAEGAAHILRVFDVEFERSTGVSRDVMAEARVAVANGEQHRHADAVQLQADGLERGRTVMADARAARALGETTAYDDAVQLQADGLERGRTGMAEARVAVANGEQHRLADAVLLEAHVSSIAEYQQRDATAVAALKTLIKPQANLSPEDRFKAKVEGARAKAATNAKRWRADLILQRREPDFVETETLLIDWAEKYGALGMKSIPHMLEKAERTRLRNKQRNLFS